MKIGVLHVILWTFGVRLALMLAVPIVAALSPGLATDLVMQAALLALFYLGACAIFAARRPGRTWSESFALRGTSVWLAVLALALGLAASIPSWELAGLVERVAPMTDAEQKAHEKLLDIRSLGHGAAMFFFVAGVGPFAEELLFRGALYTGLRPHHGAAYAGWTTAVLFTLVHDPRIWPPILLLSGVLSVVRAVSGSLWPPVFLHVAFNATAVGVPFLPSLVKDPSIELVLGCTGVSAVLLAGIAWVGGRSASADRARRVDLEPDPGLGEAES